ncbi:Triacylglycerol lipase [Trichostrongylus colubriformis]|uniref:Triacylglycerol lipase n=1 Tax=Trichostrongylus colubriformis TaxID=6319 RepID=A0AAN8IER6_TRICO
MIFLLVLSYLGYTSAATQYSDSFARNVMFPLSAAAYSERPQECLDRLFPNSTLGRVVAVQCDTFKADLCSGFVAVLHQQKAIVLSFRGTAGFKQLLQEINKTVFLNLASWFFGGKISRYFSDAFANIWSAGMSEEFFSLRNQYPEYEIWVTGHSLGGSLASLAASFMVGSHIAKPSEVKLMTFGQPRTGDTRFSSTHNSQLEYSFRVTHWRDIVPHIPMGPLGGYFHHRQEAFYKQDMNPDALTICEEAEAPECSDGLWFTASIEEHTHYFGRHVSQYGQSGCAP